MSDTERARLIQDFIDSTFGDLDVNPEFVEMLRAATPDLPDDSTTEQVQAWVELAELDRTRTAARASDAWPSTRHQNGPPATAPDCTPTSRRTSATSSLEHWTLIQRRRALKPCRCWTGWSVVTPTPSGPPTATPTGRRWPAGSRWHKAVVRRWVELTNAKELDGLDGLTCDTYDYVGQRTGVAWWKEVFAFLYATLPDWRWTLEDIVAEHDRVAARLTVHGTHHGSAIPCLKGVRPTGRSVV